MNGDLQIKNLGTADCVIIPNMVTAKPGEAAKSTFLSNYWHGFKQVSTISRLSNYQIPQLDRDSTQKLAPRTDLGKISKRHQPHANAIQNHLHPLAIGCEAENWPSCRPSGFASLPTPSFAALQRCPSSCAAQSLACAAATASSSSAAAFEPFSPLARVGGAAADPFHDDWKHW